jgi:hypothetical protein
MMMNGKFVPCFTRLIGPWMATRLDIRAAFPGAVEEQHQRPFFVRGLAVIGWQVEQILQFAARVLFQSKVSAVTGLLLV